MSIVKMVELSSQSSDSWEEATRQAVERAAQTLRNIRSVWVKEFEGVVENEQATQFRVILKIAFQLNEDANARSTRSMGSEEILGLERDPQGRWRSHGSAVHDGRSSSGATGRSLSLQTPFARSDGYVAYCRALRNAERLKRVRLSCSGSSLNVSS